jgi:hypothetical protein
VEESVDDSFDANVRFFLNSGLTITKAQKSLKASWVSRLKNSSLANNDKILITW